MTNGRFGFAPLLGSTKEAPVAGTAPEYSYTTYNNELQSWNGVNAFIALICGFAGIATIFVGSFLVKLLVISGDQPDPPMPKPDAAKPDKSPDFEQPEDFSIENLA